MNAPLLSIGMIVKNEIRSLERCLKALAPLRAALPCELVIADTGSSDGTRDVAQRYADQVFDYPWTNDFAAARNAVLERCSGAWYLSIDADEYLDPDVSQLVEALLGGMQENFGLVAVRNYRTSAMEAGDFNTINGMRLFRTGTGIRYEGIIHEVPVPADHGTPVARLLDRTILHHDGYAMDLRTRKEEKTQRNMILLREALNQNPHDLRVIMQYIESSPVGSAEYIGCLYHGMEELMAQGERGTRNGSAAPLWRHILYGAVEHDLPQLEQWRTWGEEYFADSIFLRVDGAFFLQSYYYNHSRFEESLLWGERYRQGLADYQAGHYNRADEVFSSVQCAMPQEECQSKVVMAATLHHLGRDADAAEYLTGLEPDRYNASLLRLALVTLRDLHRAPETAAYMERVCAPILERVFADLSEEPRAQERRALCAAAIPQFFREGDWGLFRAVSGDLGVAARTMEQHTAEEISRCLEQIQNWAQTPELVVLHALEHQVPLPESFFQRNAEEVRETVAALSRAHNFARQVTQWTMPGRDCSPAELQFYFDLVAAGIRTVEAEDDSTLNQLTTRLAGLASRYFPALYQPSLLECPDNWSVLPGLHRFGLYLMRAQAAFERGDELGCVQALRAGLATAPAMKPATDCMLKRLERKKWEQTSPELLELADKVRAILAQYLPDDPAVLAIKQSEAYQKVAYLIEGMEAPVFGGLPQ